MKDSKVYEAMSPIARAIYEGMPTTDSAGYVLLLVVFALSAFVYHLGFAKKLKFWQNAVIYAFLFVGCLVLTFLAFFLPIVEGLIVAALILIIYKVRRISDRKHEQGKSTSA
ncbi:YlaH-like family protein [Edaphobacillus lindanitolerans]|uniref:YlaH-like protein n=1 Tax=Edaphobacillus lindanitolerans TaxID=550447 RepID=A0A1U7PLY6_9BACI|nr:YlaH-like protein [Edaphobacillus lindanitolerans]